MTTTTPLLRARAAYLNADAQADAKRIAFVRAIERERGRGRTLEDIGGELGLSRQRVMQLLKWGEAR